MSENVKTPRSSGTIDGIMSIGRSASAAHLIDHRNMFNGKTGVNDHTISEVRHLFFMDIDLNAMCREADLCYSLASLLEETHHLRYQPDRVHTSGHKALRDIH